MADIETVDAFVAALDEPERAMIVELRLLALAACAGVTEHIEWNAPSFCLEGDDRITLGVEGKGGVRAVLHPGAAVRDTTGFAFDDVDELAAWPAVDRGVMTFGTLAAIKSREAEIADLFARWLAATR